MQFHGPVRRTRYFCPYCDGSQWLFSLRPIATDRWVCTKCRHPFLLDTAAITHSLLGTITFWALFPLGLLTAAFFVAVTKADKLVWALLLGVPVFVIGLDLVVYVLCIPVGWLVASRIRGNAGPKARKLKPVRREVW